MEMYTGTCGKRKPRTGPSSASWQGHISQEEQGLQVLGQQFMLDKLPEDIFDTLFSYLSIEDAARVACVSRGYLHSWRRYPRLLFNNKTLGLNKLGIHLDEDTRALEDEQYREDKIENHFVNKINHVLENHSGFGMKALILQLFPCHIDASYLDKCFELLSNLGLKSLHWSCLR